MTDIDQKNMDAYIKRVTPKNVSVYGINEACIAAGYSMVTKLPDEMRATDRDYKRGTRLGHTSIGSGEDKFLRFIVVAFDWELPRYMWQEVDTYHFIERSSMSTMHKLLEMDFEKACTPYTTPHVLDMVHYKIKCYKQAKTREEREFAWLELKANTPEGLMLGSRVLMNYAQLKTIYHQRKAHRNMEWRVFCDWIKQLPMAERFGVCGE